MRTTLLVVAVYVVSQFGMRSFGQPPAQIREFDQPAEVDLLSLDVVEAVEKVVTSVISQTEKSVVAITRGRKIISSQADEPSESATKDGDKPTIHEYGTGVIVDTNGLVLTNYHLLGDVQDSTFTVIHQGNQYPATVKAADPWTDLAVLKFNAKELLPVRAASKLAVQKGQFVISLGDPYSIAKNTGPNATWGIIANVSAKVQPNPEVDETVYRFGQLIQTDAKLKHGTSGGPLVNLKGEMIGLVTSAVALEGYDSDAGYAIVLDEAMLRIIERLKNGERTDFGFLGIQPESLSETEIRSGQHGVRLSSISKRSPAEVSGLQASDVVTHINDSAVNEPNDVFRLVGLAPPETELKITLRRTDRILRRTRVLTRNVTLSKKFVSAQRPAIAEQAVPEWRGIQVDYPTAVENFDELTDRIDSDGCVIVTSVEFNSVGWTSGVREGDLIVEAAGTRVRRPTDFLAATSDRQSRVQLRVLGESGQKQSLFVEPLIQPE